MTQYTPEFQEEYIAGLPALSLLTYPGWSFLSLEQTLLPATFARFKRRRSNDR